MPLKPYYQIAGLPPKPHFLLKDHTGREFAVVEHYETDRAKATGHTLLEFFTTDPSLKARPLVWLDVERWEVLAGHGKNLPDADFEHGLQAFLQSFPDSERDVRRDRARRARYSDLIDLIEKGYTIAFQELFPREVRREDFPTAAIAGKNYLVDDQYHAQPGDFRNQVTLVFIPESAADAANVEPDLLCNWIFGEGYEIVRSSLSESLSHEAVSALVKNEELEKIYKERLLKVRREAALLGVKPKPYSPTTPVTPVTLSTPSAQHAPSNPSHPSHPSHPDSPGGGKP